VDYPHSVATKLKILKYTPPKTKPTMLPPSRPIQGLKGLATFLNNERSKLQRDTIVLIASEPTITTKASSSAKFAAQHFRPGVEEAVKQIRALLQQRLAFRVAPVQVRTAIPDPSSVKLYEMVKRVAAKTIIAVGSGNAMDVAKWCSAHHHSSIHDDDRPRRLPIQRIIYVPATYGACLVAHAPHSLTVQPQTGEIAVYDDNQDEDSIYDAAPGSVIPPPTVHHVLLDEDHFDTSGKNIALAAAWAIAADAAGAETTGALPALPTTMLSSHADIYEFLATTGRTRLSYGLSDDNTRPRSKPLAIATALQATLFPNYSLMEIMASLLPAYYDNDNDNDKGDTNNSMIQALDVPQFLTTEPWDTVLDSLRENAATWNCWDAPADDFRTLLSKRHMI
jgi:hypothetical protein